MKIRNKIFPTQLVSLLVLFSYVIFSAHSSCVGNEQIMRKLQKVDVQMQQRKQEALKDSAKVEALSQTVEQGFKELKIALSEEQDANQIEELYRKFMERLNALEAFPRGSYVSNTYGVGNHSNGTLMGEIKKKDKIEALLLEKKQMQLSLEEKLKENNDMLSRLEHENKNLKGSLKGVDEQREAEIKKRKSIRISLENKLEKARKEAETLAYKKQFLKTIISERDYTISKLNTDLNNLQDKFNQKLADANNNLLKLNAAPEQLCEGLCDWNKRFQASDAEFRDRLQQKDNEIQTLRSEHESELKQYKELLENRGAEITALESNRSEMKKQIAATTTNNAELNSAVTNLEKYKGWIEEKYISLEKQIKANKQSSSEEDKRTIQELKKQLDELYDRKWDMDDLQGKLNKAQRDNFDLEDKYKDEISSLNKSVDELSQKLFKYENKFKAQADELNKLHCNYTFDEDNYASMEAATLKAEGRCREQKCEYEKQIEELRVQLEMQSNHAIG